MSRARLAAVALRVLPRQTRTLPGEEMLDTLLDASDAASRVRFARELVDLMRVGLNARARQTAEVGAQRLLADGFCQGALLVMALDLSTLVSQKLDGINDPLLAWTSICALGVIFATALIGAERLAGVAALVWTAVRFPELVAHNPTFNGIAPTVVPLLCFSVLTVSPRRRGLDLRRVAWLAAIAALVAAYAPRGGGGVITAIVSLAAILLMLTAILRIPTDPRLAIACALPVTYLGLTVAGTSTPPALLLFVAPPLVMFAAIVRVLHQDALRESPAD
jgi:hypothetical protein